MQRYRFTQFPTGIKVMQDNKLKLNIYHGRLDHRADYSDADYKAVVDWLNDREQGYPEKHKK